MVVSGERRWQAHKIANIKTIPCVVKEYKTDGQFMVESLIENLHRENLSPQEASKFARKIMQVEKIVSTYQLAKRISTSHQNVMNWFDADEMRKKLPKAIREKVSPTVIYETKSLPEKERVELIKKAVEEDFGGSKMRQLVSEIKSGDKPEPIQFERTANDVVDDILSNLHDFKFQNAFLTKSLINCGFLFSKATAIISRFVKLNFFNSSTSLSVSNLYFSNCFCKSSNSVALNFSSNCLLSIPARLI